MQVPSQEQALGGARGRLLSQPRRRDAAGPPRPGLTPARPRAPEGPVSVDLLPCDKDKHCPRLGILPAPVSMTQQNLWLFTQQRRECLLQLSHNRAAALLPARDLPVLPQRPQPWGLGAFVVERKGSAARGRAPSRPRAGVAGEGRGGQTRIRDLFPLRMVCKQASHGDLSTASDWPLL